MTIAGPMSPRSTGVSLWFPLHFDWAQYKRLGSACLGSPGTRLAWWHFLC